jgi:hypothetical protein
MDVIVVPASRGGYAVESAARLAIKLGAPLVALCSKKAVGDEVAARLAELPGCHTLVVDMPHGYSHCIVPKRTSGKRYQVVEGDASDLWLKRNLGLMLARLHGWGKVLFFDDDISDSATGLGIPVETARRLAAQLDDEQIAALTCRDFPDSSVVGHAKRFVGLSLDTFLTGAALAINCNDQPLPFLPNQYNEDWFFIARSAANRELTYIGEATQRPYDPFEDPRPRPPRGIR